MVAMRHAKRKSDEPADVLRRVGKQVKGVAEQVKSGAVTATREAKQEIADVTRALAETVKEEAERLFDAQRDRAASKVSRVSKVARQTAHALHAVRMDAIADVVDATAEQVDRASKYIKDRDLGELMDDASEVVNRHRALAVGGMLVAGFALARFLKATAERDEADDDDQDSDDDRDDEDEAESDDDDDR